MKELIRNICDYLENGQELVLATICDHSGSTPRSTGAKMAILPDGSIAGTIGGGSAEGQVIQTAPEIFKNKCGRVQPFHLTGKDAAATDMICGGELNVFLEYLAPNKENLQVFQAAWTALNKGKSATLITDVSQLESDNPETPWTWQRWVMTEGDVPDGLPRPSEEIMNMARDSFHRPLGAATLDVERSRILFEDLLVPGTVYVAGAGHVSLFTAALAAKVGFNTVIFDDREEFANKERFPDIDKVLVLKDFDRCLEAFTFDEDSYLLIITRGHLHDKTVLRQALRTPLGYIGMIGSRSKRDKLYRELLDTGFTQADLDRVYSPIGLPIGADTPEEIAVSIVGELIKVRAQRRAPGGKL